jgi:Ca2+-binding RTX toxin-like protein
VSTFTNPAAGFLARLTDLQDAFGPELFSASAAWHWRGFGQPILGTRGGDLLYGTPEDDVILGLAGDDTIFGAGGHDALVGGRGDDTISGGFGVDTMTGGGGADVFRFGSPTAPTVIPWAVVGDALGDRITDFEVGVDTIDLSALGTRRGLDGAITDPHTFRFIGTGGFHGDAMTPEVRYEHLVDGTTRVTADGFINPVIKEGPDGRPDLFILLNGHLALSAGDFIL